MQELSGSVGDGPVAGADLTVYTNGGEEIERTVSDQTAAYNVQVRTKGKHYPLLIEATGGTDLVTNVAPDFKLAGAALGPGRNEVANISPFSTLAVAIAQELPGGLTTENIVAGVEAVVTELGSGLDSLASAEVIDTEIDESNAAEMVKASETLAEIFRRTNEVIVASRGESSVEAVIDALGSDLADGRLEGAGGANVDPQVSAVARVAAGDVSLEAISNTLHVHGADATSALDGAIATIAPEAADAPTASLPISENLIAQAKLGVAAASALEPTEDLAALAEALDSLQAGMLPTEAVEALPAGAATALDPALTRLTNGVAEDVAAVNAVSGGEAPGTGDPEPTDPTDPT
ncbi:MAG: hypothetical protein JXB36_03630, partial [Gammaproteobacteria bacterium]|nr:hypothetical protein [Gammaproteobacteria bacterium]